MMNERALKGSDRIDLAVQNFSRTSAVSSILSIVFAYFLLFLALSNVLHSETFKCIEVAVSSNLFDLTITFSKKKTCLGWKHKLYTKDLYNNTDSFQVPILLPPRTAR